MKLLEVDMNKAEGFQVTVEIQPDMKMHMGYDYAKRYYPELFQTETVKFELTIEHCYNLRTKLIAKALEAFPNLDQAVLDRVLVVSQGPIHFDLRMRTTLGTANYSKNLIKLHYRALNGHREQTDKTFTHELAHLLSVAIFGIVNGRGHGIAWKRVMLALGLNPKRTHSHDVSEFRRTHKPKGFAKCACTEQHPIKTAMYNKMMRGISYKCLKCNTRLQLIGLRIYE